MFAALALRIAEITTTSTSGEWLMRCAMCVCRCVCAGGGGGGGGRFQVHPEFGDFRGRRPSTKDSTVPVRACVCVCVCVCVSEFSRSFGQAFFFWLSSRVHTPKSVQLDNGCCPDRISS